MNNKTVENAGSNPTLPYDDDLLQENMLHTAFRHRWIILSTTILFLVVAFLYLLKVTPIYTSSSRVYVEQSGPKIINEYEGVMTRATNYLFTQVELIQSTPIIAQVVSDAQIKRLETTLADAVLFLKC
jgi:uncharacterized protein involved in exopolysaccharide biosynthesis